MLYNKCSQFRFLACLYEINTNKLYWCVSFTELLFGKLRKFSLLFLFEPRLLLNDVFVNVSFSQPEGALFQPPTLKLHSF